MTPALRLCLGLVALLAAAAPAHAEDGHRLWLRAPKNTAAATVVEVEKSSPMTDTAATELRRGLAGRVARVLLATTADPRVPALRMAPPVGDEGYAIRSAQLAGRRRPVSR